MRLMAAKRTKRVRVSSGALEILSMLWDQGSLTLAEAHARFGRFGRPVGYPTMQTRLNRLVEKRLVHKTDDRPAKYRAAVTPQQVSAGHIGQLLDQIGRPQLVPLVANLLSGQKLTRTEIDELKRLLAKAEQSRSQRPTAGEEP